jgi:hypothetical protein
MNRAAHARRKQEGGDDYEFRHDPTLTHEDLRSRLRSFALVSSARQGQISLSRRSPFSPNLASCLRAVSGVPPLTSPDRTTKRPALQETLALQIRTANDRRSPSDAYRKGL